jgi:hypothetical protein
MDRSKNERNASDLKLRAATISEYQLLQMTMMVMTMMSRGRGGELRTLVVLTWNRLGSSSHLKVNDKWGLREKSSSDSLICLNVLRVT